MKTSLYLVPHRGRRGDRLVVGRRRSGGRGLTGPLEGSGAQRLLIVRDDSRCGVGRGRDSGLAARTWACVVDPSVCEKSSVRRLIGPVLVHRVSIQSYKPSTHLIGRSHDHIGVW